MLLVASLSIMPMRRRSSSRAERATRRRRAERRNRGERRERGPHKADPGYERLFINLGKRDNFYAREIINLINRYVKGKIQIGRIDLTNNCSFFEVPEEDAPIVLKKMARVKVGNRPVVVDAADRVNPKRRGENARP